MTAKLIKGENLTARQIQEVKSAFGYRWTIENMPRAKQWHGEHAPTIEPTSDAQWIKEHAFYIRKDGKLASTPRHCEPAFMAEV